MRWSASIFGAASASAVIGVSALAAGCGGGSTKTVTVGASGAAAVPPGHLTRIYRVPSKAMVPTVVVGSRVVVDLDAYSKGSPRRNDVIVFRPPAGADTNTCGIQPPVNEACPKPTRQPSSNVFIKRVVAVGGDRVKIIDNRTYLNGRLQPEPFIATGTPCDSDTCTLRHEVTVPSGYVFVLGDNRGTSADSRIWGPVPTGWIVGKVLGVK